jgi:hypothetical protein
MKKIIALALALALLLTSAVAFAETHATPNINSFATMKVKYVGGMFNNNNTHMGADNYYLITLSKPVDRLLVNWAEKDAEPEELAVGEDLTATAIAWGHKYMPGTEQKLGTSTIKDKVEKVQDSRPTASWYWEEDYEWGQIIHSSSWAYKTHDVVTLGNRSTPAYFNETTTKQLAWTIVVDHETVDNTGKTIPVYKVTYPNLSTKYVNENNDQWPEKTRSFYSDSLAYIQKLYEETYPGTTVELTAPQKWTTTVNGTDIFGNPTTSTKNITQNFWDDEAEYSVGKIQGYTVTTKVNTKLSTVKATPDQTAFMTVQGEWAVYYNRAGKIVGIEYFDGQF